MDGGINAAMAAIMAEAKAIGKESRNNQQGFNFRGIDAVMNHLHPIFSKHGVIVLPEVLGERTEERQTKSGGHLLYRILTVKFSFVAADGSSVSSVVIGEGMDSGDKAANKAMAVALKYALTQMLLLPYDEVDPDAETPPESRKAIPEKAQVAQKVKIVLGEVKIKSGEGHNGPWNRFYSKADDGKFYSTFDSKIGDMMTNLANDGEPVKVTYKLVVSAKGESRDVLAVEPAQLPAATAADEPADADTERKGQSEMPF